MCLPSPVFLPVLSGEGGLGGSGSCRRGGLGERPGPSLLFLGRAHCPLSRTPWPPSLRSHTLGPGPSSPRAPARAASSAAAWVAPGRVNAAAGAGVGNWPFFVKETEAGLLSVWIPVWVHTLLLVLFDVARFSLCSHFSLISSPLCVSEVSLRLRQGCLWGGAVSAAGEGQAGRSRRTGVLSPSLYPRSVPGFKGKGCLFPRKMSEAHSLDGALGQPRRPVPSLTIRVQISMLRRVI